MKEDALQTADWAQIIEEKNAEIEPRLQAEFAEQEAKKKAKWEALRRKPPRKPATWEVFWKNNKFKRSEGRGGVDAMRYCEEVIKPLLLPFIEELNG
jgi:hypothetical protein